MLTYRVSLVPERYPEVAQRQAFYEQLLARTRVLPGVVAAGITTSVPLGGHWGNFYEAEGAAPRREDDNPVILQRVISPEYLETIGVTLRAGRFFDRRDGITDGARVTIVNDSLIRLFWPGAEPEAVVGRRIRPANLTDEPNDSPWLRVVGVTADTRHYGLDTPMRPGLFLPYARISRGSMTVVLRTTAAPTAMIRAARGVVAALDPDLPIYGVTTMSDELGESLWVRRTYSWLLAAFALVALGLALAGLYGVVSYAVSRRSREIGIRMALGAQRPDIMRQVLSWGMRLVGLGVIVGLAASAIAGRFLSELLFGVSAFDVPTYLTIVVAITVVGALATIVPARRASSVDPMRVLRVE